MKRPLALYLAASAPISALFFLTPFELYYNAQPYWDWHKSLPLSFALFGTLLYVLLCVLLFILIRFARHAAVAVAHTLFLIGAFALLADVFSPLRTSPMDGTPLVSAEPLLSTAIEVALLVSLLTVFLRLSPRARVVAAATASGAMALVAAGYLTLVASSTRPEQTRASLPVSRTGAIVGNVYHIVLDAAQTDAALAALAANGRSDAFTGFTVFTNNTSNYLYTHASFPSYMTGSFYESGSFEHWTEEAFKTHGLLKAVHDKGYATTMYGFLRSWDNPYIDTFRSLGDVFSDSTRVKNRSVADFSQIWLARSMPNVLTNEALAAGLRLGRFVQRLDSTAGGHGIPILYEDGRDTYSSVVMMREALATERTRSANGQYVYMHAVLPHPPFVFDAQCTYDLGLRRTRDGYFQQLDCALSLVLAFLSELRRLGRYDDATIVIHGDHGEGRGFVSTAGGRRWTLRDATVGTFLNSSPGLPEDLLVGQKDWLLSRSMALLMIKPARSSGPMRLSKRTSQLIDVYPTLSELLALETPVRGVGENVFRSEAEGRRTPSIFWFEQFDRQPDVVQLEIEDPTNLPESAIAFGRIVNDLVVRDLVGSMSIDIASRSAALDRFRLLGFSGIEGIGDTAWRWSVGPESDVVLRGLRVRKDTRVWLGFEVRPLASNVGNEMSISTARSSATVRLVEGFRSYRVALTLPAGVDPSFKFRYATSARPVDLGLGNDSRQLAVAWRKMDVSVGE
jgi:Sulfatase